MKRLVLVANNLRSTHNVGSLLRTADGLGVEKVFFTGYTPYPAKDNDPRLPHIQAKVTLQIHKTALGAEQSVNWEYSADLKSLISDLKHTGFIVLALEQTPVSIELQNFKASGQTALIVGNEVEGIEDEITSLCDKVLMIPMAGQKESFNVAVAAGMALYHLKFG